jgi:hypothetical protein
VQGWSFRCLGTVRPSRGGLRVQGHCDEQTSTDYLPEHSIAHAFHHNAFLVVSNGDAARHGSITSKWEHSVEWKRNAENVLVLWNVPKIAEVYAREWERLWGESR